MEIISTIGMVAAIALLIFLCFKGVNGVIASLIATVVVIVTSGMNFWTVLTETYATTMGSTLASYFFIFCVASAYSELMKQSGAAESIANFLFRFIGAKATCIGTMIIAFLLAYSGINAFIIIFAIYPIACPMFKKANLSKLLMPAIFLYGSVVLNVVTPGNPSSLNVALCNALGTTSFAAPAMSIVILICAFAIGIVYFTFAQKRMRAAGIGFVPSESDAQLLAGEEEGKELPKIWNAGIPFIVIIVLKFALNNVMTASNGICTSILVGTALLIILNYKYLKGHIVKDFANGWMSSISPLLLTAGLMGFAAVINICDGFQIFSNLAVWLGEKFNPYISSVISVNIFSAITGGSLSGAQIFINTLLPDYLEMGINNAALHKILQVAAMGLDTLPHCPTFIMMASVCGVTAKESYKHVLVLTVITPIVLAFIGVLCVSIGIV